MRNTIETTDDNPPDTDLDSLDEASVSRSASVTDGQAAKRIQEIENTQKTKHESSARNVVKQCSNEPPAMETNPGDPTG